MTDLKNLCLEEERLKFERDTAFKAAMAGLARVRELELRQQELRERGMEMLRRGMKTLDELDEAEEKERSEVAAQAQSAAGVQDPTSVLFGDPNFDPSDPFWATLDFGGEMPQASQGT